LAGVIQKSGRKSEVRQVVELGLHKPLGEFLEGKGGMGMMLFLAISSGPSLLLFLQPSHQHFHNIDDVVVPMVLYALWPHETGRKPQNEGVQISRDYSHPTLFAIFLALEYLKIIGSSLTL
jgi:hypothetical protein